MSDTPNLSRYSYQTRRDLYDAMANLIEIFEDAIYDACVELNITTSDMFNQMIDTIIKEAEDDLRTEPLILNGYDFDLIMNMTQKRSTFHRYMDFRYKWYGKGF